MNTIQIELTAEQAAIVKAILEAKSQTFVGMSVQSAGLHKISEFYAIRDVLHNIERAKLETV